MNMSPGKIRNEPMRNNRAILPPSPINQHLPYMVQCKMALVREGLWESVSETEVLIDTEADAKYLATRDHTLATNC